MPQNYMVIIDDLEKVESQKIVNFLKDAIESGDIDLAIQDCISIAKELKFHQFSNGLGTENGLCKICKKRENDTIHRLEVEEET